MVGGGGAAEAVEVDGKEAKTLQAHKDMVSGTHSFARLVGLPHEHPLNTMTSIGRFLPDGALSFPSSLSLLFFISSLHTLHSLKLTTCTWHCVLTPASAHTFHTHFITPASLRVSPLVCWDLRTVLRWEIGPYVTVKFPFPGACLGLRTSLGPFVGMTTISAKRRKGYSLWTRLRTYQPFEVQR